MIRWNDEKNKDLQRDRGISFEEIAEIIMREEYIEILENPSHPEQMIFIINYQNYTWVIPFVLEDEETIFLKTAFPSRKFHKKYGDRYGKEET